MARLIIGRSPKKISKNIIKILKAVKKYDTEQDVAICALNVYSNGIKPENITISNCNFKK